MVLQKVNISWWRNEKSSAFGIPISEIFKSLKQWDEYHWIDGVKFQFPQKHYTLKDFKGYSSNSCDIIWQMVLLCYQAPLMHKMLILPKRSCVVLIKNCTENQKWMNR